MASERACLAQVVQSEDFKTANYLFKNAQNIHYRFFGTLATSRTAVVGLKHDPTIRISVPDNSNPIFRVLEPENGAPRLFTALSAYLTFITTHPFLDGNGRTARVLFSAMLSKRDKQNTHYIPLAELTCSGNGIYEELLSRSGLDGDYRVLISYLLTLIENYALFLRSPRVLVEQPELLTVCQLIEDFARDSENANINFRPPFPIASPNLMRHRKNIGNNTFIENLAKLIDQVCDYGDVEIVLISTGSLLRVIAPQECIVAIFLKIKRKEDFLLRARSIRMCFSNVLRIKFVQKTEDAVIDAKLMIDTAETLQRLSKPGDQLAVLHDFMAFPKIET